MGKGPTSKTSESSLSRAQASILKERNAAYNSYFKPILQGELKATEGDGLSATFADQSMQGVNASFQNAERDLGRSIGQRGVTGGMLGSSLAALHGARATTAANTASRATLQNKQLRHGLLGMGLDMSPKPTTASPFHSKSS